MDYRFGMRQIWRRVSRRRCVSGFTLLELLVSMLIASIVVSGLLYVVVELLQIDRREALLSQTQEDTQRAMAYIADDIKESVYIFPDPSVLTQAASPQLDDLPDSSTPVLAFWKPVPIEESLPDCSRWEPDATDEDEEKYAQCRVLTIRQASYSLVVYLQKERDDAVDTLWKGASRIIRYELDQYKDIAELDITPGYQDPTSVGFASWESTDDDTEGDRAVLVDFIDAPSVENPPTTGTNPCLSIGADYTPVPADVVEEQNPSFYGCVKNPLSAAAIAAIAAAEAAGETPPTFSANANQDIFLFLRGNARDGAQGVVGVAGERSALPTLETRVLMRGVLNKSPE